MRAFSLVNGAMALVFVAFAALQLNDPDPVGWAILYAAAALSCALDFRAERSIAPPAALGAIALVWAALLAPEALRLGRWREIVATMSAANPGVELLREMLGLLIVATWMAVLAARAYRARRARERLS